MITIITATKKAGKGTKGIINFYKKTLEEMGKTPNILWIDGIDLNKRSEELDKAEKEVLIPADKFIFILPEYNGSFPGALKTLIDMCNIPDVFYGKKALLTGIAYGRAGNLRGMEHFTGILNHMKVVVHPNRLPISVLKKLVNNNYELTDTYTKEVIQQQLKEFLSF